MLPRALALALGLFRATTPTLFTAAADAYLASATATPSALLTSTPDDDQTTTRNKNLATDSTLQYDTPALSTPATHTSTTRTTAPTTAYPPPHTRPRSFRPAPCHTRSVDATLQRIFQIRLYSSSNTISFILYESYQPSPAPTRHQQGQCSTARPAPCLEQPGWQRHSRLKLILCPCPGPLGFQQPHSSVNSRGSRPPSLCHIRQPGLQLAESSISVICNDSSDFHATDQSRIRSSIRVDASISIVVLVHCSLAALKIAEMVIL